MLPPTYLLKWLSKVPTSSPTRLSLAGTIPCRHTTRSLLSLVWNTTSWSFPGDTLTPVTWDQRRHVQLNTSKYVREASSVELFTGHTVATGSGQAAHPPAPRVNQQREPKRPRPVHSEPGEPQGDKSALQPPLNFSVRSSKQKKKKPICISRYVNPMTCSLSSRLRVLYYSRSFMAIYFAWLRSAEAVKQPQGSQSATVSNTDSSASPSGGGRHRRDVTGG